MGGLYLNCIKCFEKLVDTRYWFKATFAMDAVFVHLAKNYYLNGKAPWADKKLLGKIQELVDKTEPNLIGRIAPELIMKNFSKIPFNRAVPHFK